MVDDPDRAEENLLDIVEKAARRWVVRVVAIAAILLLLIVAYWLISGPVSDVAK